MKKELKPCPECGTRDPWLIKIHLPSWFFTKYFVECRGCHYCGKTKIGKRMAIWHWNRRAEDGN